MSIESNSNDGSDIFWPGYVDAVTNLVLNLLFLLTIMTVAVFMFALELGRASLGGTGKKPVVTQKADTNTDPKFSADAIKENAALKREIHLLNMKLAKMVPPPKGGEAVKIVSATAGVPLPKKGLDITIVTDAEVIVRFTDEAVTLTKAEYGQLREALKTIVASGKSRILVEVPTGFTEARRMGFYRAMAVRNLMIEMKMPQDRIDVSVREGKNNANASLVRVRSR
ncbi:MAG: hypothetical protein J0665_11900 [Deltaproteobacteria bacterium]|nr:hypothetical protein [Deltaproteobacteria bacterium]